MLSQGLNINLIHKISRKNLVRVNSKKAKLDYILDNEDEVALFIDVELNKKTITTSKKINRKLIDEVKKSIIYKDSSIIAIDKISGLAVQGGTKTVDSIDDILPHLKFDNLENPKLVHRLDKDTSGVLLIARNRKSADLLSDYFKKRLVKKTYLALCKGITKKKCGVINIPLIKKYQGKNEKVYQDQINGKEAITKYEVIAEFLEHNLTLFKLEPKTGRTHQIRVHLKEIGHPIIGDFKYGTNNTNFDEINSITKSLKKSSKLKILKKRLYLHALNIEIEDFLGKKINIKTNDSFIKLLNL